MKNMLTRTILLVLLVAILPSCEREHLSCYSETGNVILNIRPMDNDIDVDAINQYAIKIIPEYAGEILVGKIGNFNWPLSLNSGYYRIEIHSSVISVKDDTEYRYYGLSNLFKVESKWIYSSTNWNQTIGFSCWKQVTSIIKTIK